MTQATTRHLRETRFINERLSLVGIELLRIADLFKRVPHSVLLQPERVEFALLLVVDHGSGTHLVDFRQVGLTPGAVVAVRPGAVQQWQATSGLDGDVLLIEPQLLQPRVALSTARVHVSLVDDWPSHFMLQSREQEHWVAISRLLREELNQSALDELSVEAARALLQSLLLTLARGAQQASPKVSPHDLMCRRLFRELDQLVAVRPSVEVLAQRLGTSPSTLGRACQSALGLTAKEVVDRRVSLEAKRLLVHTQGTAVSIGEQLGFSEPTNFLKFFKRCSGMTPEQFRRAQRSST